MYATYPTDPELNFPPLESYRNRAVASYNAETYWIDAIMYRITDQAHTNALIAAKQRGVRVRVLSEQQQYRDPSRLWHSWNIDRLYMAGIEIKHRGHAGQKTVLLHGQRTIIFGSSNWTSPSNQTQEEHNYFVKREDIYLWFVNWRTRHEQATCGASPRKAPERRRHPAAGTSCSTRARRPSRRGGGRS